jgi:hypothetical protein
MACWLYWNDLLVSFMCHLKVQRTYFPQVTFWNSLETTGAIASQHELYERFSVCFVTFKNKNSSGISVPELWALDTQWVVYCC